MGSAAFVLMINLVLGVILLIAFSAIWLRERERRSALMWALGVLCYLGTGTIEMLAPFYAEGKAPLHVMGVYTTNALAIVLIVHGIGLHYRLPSRAMYLASLAVMGMAVVSFTLDLPRESLVRLAVTQAPLVIITLYATVRILMVRNPRLLDRLVAAAFALYGVQLASRPALAATLGGLGTDPSTYMMTRYAIVSQSTLAIITLVVASLLMLLLARDIFTELAARGETDPLTGLLNRRGLENRTTATVHGPHGSCVVISDIDKFKSINDRFGHAAGDRVIEALASIMKGTARSQDPVARIGGEEFVVVLPGAPVEIGRLFAEGVRCALESMAFEPVERTPITASFGVAAWLPGAPLDEAIERADAALYEAKSSGRNRVVIDMTLEQAGSKASRADPATDAAFPSPVPQRARRSTDPTPAAAAAEPENAAKANAA